MSWLIEEYNRIFQKTTSIRDGIEQAKQEIANIQDGRAAELPARIARLEEQLEKIDDYSLKIDAYRKLAEKNLESQNVLSIETPPGYRINLNRLRRWAMMIDPMASDDPYAQRLYVTAKCDLSFLMKKKEEFTERIEQLRHDEGTGLNGEIHRLKQKILQLTEELKSIAVGADMASFAERVIRENKSYWYETAPNAYSNRKERVPFLSPGACAPCLEIPEEQRLTVKTMFGKFYDSDNSRVLLPVEIAADREFAMAIQCAPPCAEHLDRGLQNFILQMIESYPAGTVNVYILDGVRYNSAALGSLKQIEGTFVLAPVPGNPEQMSAVLEQMVSSFAELDDHLELCDSVMEYNQTAGQAKQLCRTAMILFGWPGAFEGRDREYLQRMMANYERYGISFICVTYLDGTEEKGECNDLPGQGAQNAIRITMMPKDTFIQLGEEPQQRFTWYAFSDLLPPEYAESIFEIIKGL